MVLEGGLEVLRELIGHRDLQTRTALARFLSNVTCQPKVLDTLVKDPDTLKGVLKLVRSDQQELLLSGLVSLCKSN